MMFVPQAAATPNGAAGPILRARVSGDGAVENTHNLRIVRTAMALNLPFTTDVSQRVMDVLLAEISRGWSLRKARRVWSKLGLLVTPLALVVTSIATLLRN